MAPAELEMFVAKQTIQELIASYSIYVDTGQVDSFASIFTEDGVWEWEQAGLSFCGRRSLRALCEAVKTHAGGAQHATSNLMIEVEGDSARSICQLTTFLSQPQQIHTLMLGYYEDDLVRIRDRWLISRRSLRVENMEVLSSGVIGDLFAPLAEAVAQIE